MRCGASLAGMRADARWASPACRMRVKRGASPNEARTRRPSRDGRGVRLYIRPEDEPGDHPQKGRSRRARKGGGVMGKKLTQREPGSVAIQKGLDSLVAGLNVRNPGYRWRVS